MKIMLHEPEHLEDTHGNRHLVAGLVEVDANGLLIVPEDAPDGEQDVAQPQALPEAVAQPMAG